MMADREDILLAPYAQKSRDSRGRQYPENLHPYRTIYQRDRDRILHSSAFRRLEHKTQVFIVYECDYYRNRLTHTLEMTQIARTIARALGLNEDLTEAISLAHDLGHTPFGHAGESALNRLMKDFGGFNHNDQTIRVVELLENRYQNFPGLNLSWEVRESLRKHSKTYSIEDEFLPGKMPLLEAQVSDLADAIAYDTHDLDDAIKANLVNIQEAEKLTIWQRAKQSIKESIKDSLDTESYRKFMIRTIIDIIVSDLISTSLTNLKQNNIQTTDDVRNYRSYLISFSSQITEEKKELEGFLHKNVYNHERVLGVVEKMQSIIEVLFNAYIRAPERIPLQFRKWLDSFGLERVVCDYIAGMTDRFAIREYNTYLNPG